MQFFQKSILLIFVSALLASCNESPPTITGIEPKKGLTGVETSVIIRGKNFAEGELSVGFEDADVEILSASSELITVKVKADTPGSRDVKITNKDGSSENNFSFEFIPSPKVNSILPDTGVEEGRTLVCISGENLDYPKLQVKMGGISVEILRTKSNELMFLSPPGANDGSISIHVPLGDISTGISYRYSKNADLNSGDLVSLKVPKTSGDLDKAALDELIKSSNETKRKLLAELGRCGLQLGSFFETLPHIHLLNASANDLENFRKSSRVESVSPNERLTLQTTQSRRRINYDHPNLPKFPKLGKDTAVVVVDTGVDHSVQPFGCSEPGPSCSVKVSLDIARDDGVPDDQSRHGTNVAAIVKAVAPGVDIISLDVIDGGGTSTVIVLKAIDWAILNQSKFNIVSINLSLSGRIKSKEPCMLNSYGPAAVRARNAGILVVASSGNDGWIDGLPAPACSPAVISVGAVYDANVGAMSYPSPGCTDTSTKKDQVTCFSNFAYWLSMLAPGSEIDAGGVVRSGTSQAAPHVSGSIAVLASMFPSDTTSFRRKRIEKTGTPVEDVRIPSSTGKFKRRLDLLASYNGELFRPKSLPKVLETWPVVSSRIGKYGIIADTPVFRTSSKGALKDQLSGVDWWPELKLVGPIHLQRAGYRCSRYPMKDATPFGWMRLPTRSELISILDPTRLDGFVDPILGPNMSTKLWSLSPDRTSNSSPAQWVVDFKIGDSRRYGDLSLPVPGQTAHHRCVVVRFDRQPIPSERFKSIGITVKDSSTGLIWLKSLSQHKLHYEQASEYCANLKERGLAWRVPTFKELASLMSYEEKSAVDPNIFEIGNALLSSTVDVRKRTGMGDASFLGVNEKKGYFLKSVSNGNVRCVVQRASGANPQRVLKSERYIRSALDLQALKAGDFSSTNTISIKTKDDVETLVLPGIKEIRGDLSVQGTKLKLIWFPDLVSISGNLEIRNNQSLRLISFPKLNQIGGSLVLSKLPNLSGLGNINGQTKPLFFRKLETIGGILEIVQVKLPPFSVFELLSLQSIDNHLKFEDNENFNTVRFPKLKFVGKKCNSNMDPFCGTVFLERNLGFVGIQFSSLGRVEQSFLVRANAEMTSVSIHPPQIPGYTRIANQFEITGNRSFCAGKMNTFLKTWPKNSYPSQVSITNNQTGIACKSSCRKFPPNNSTDCPIFTD